MSGQQNLPVIIDAFQEAALNPTRWQDALAGLGAAVGGSGVVMLSAYDPPAGAHLFASVGYDIDNWSRVQTEYSQPETNRYIHLLNATPSGRVLQPRTLMSMSEWLDDPIYQKFLRPDGLHDGLVSAMTHKNGGFAAVAMFRSRHYDSYHLQFLQAAIPHIRHALDVHLRLGAHLNMAAAGFGALDHLRTGVVLCDIQGGVIYTNATAQRTLRKADGIMIGKGGLLAAARPAETTQLRRLIGRAGAAATRNARNARLQHDAAAAGGSMQVSRPLAVTPLHLLVAPLRQAETTGGFSLPQRASVMIFVSDPDDGVAIEIAAVRQLYGLTPSEARLTMHLISGKDLSAVAQTMGVSINTAKTLLKRSFERTGTHRQADLVNLVLRGPLGSVARDR